MFGAAIGNLDDHLRNHGYLRVNNAWRLAPAFDMNPEPYDATVSDSHQTALLGDAEVTVDALTSPDVLALFGVGDAYAARWRDTLRSALSQAVPRARTRRIDVASVNLMAGRFSHAVEELS